MKKMDIFCSSPASTAICSSLDHRSMVRHGSTRPLDHHHHRHSSKPYATCSSSSSSRLPINPKAKNYFEKSRKSTSSVTKESDFQRKLSSADDNLRRKSSADTSDVNSTTTTTRSGSSSRYLLSDKVPYIDWISESDRTSALVLDSMNQQYFKPRNYTSSNDAAPAAARKSCSLAYYAHGDGDDRASALVTTPNSRLSSSNVSLSPALKSSSSARSCDQVVVLWVSIHCKGCEGKVRKHISKMEGVTSFSIDLATKKVTVIGNVTPLGVLASVSKVKNAQLWPSPSSTTPSPSLRWST